jgi:hypothetical protein
VQEIAITALRLAPGTRCGTGEQDFADRWIRELLGRSAQLWKVPEGIDRRDQASNDCRGVDQRVCFDERLDGREVSAVWITVGPERREVASTEAGGYLGEMSLLTGQPRTATAVARSDCRVLEITGSAFRSYVQGRPEVIDELAIAANARRKELDQARAAAGATAAPTAASLRDRMRDFFGLA